MQLRAYFENFGSVLEAFVSYDRQSGRPRGFGFVVFESAQVAEKVVASKHMIDKREVSQAVPAEEEPVHCCRRALLVVEHVSLLGMTPTQCQEGS